MTAKKKVLEVENLVVAFETEQGLVTAVKGLNFTLYKGETLGIVGESGSGKSVTSLSIMRLLLSPPARLLSGKILFHTEGGDVIDLLALSEKAMQRHRGQSVAMIFQEPMTALNPVYTCGAQVVEAIRVHQPVSYAEAKILTLELFKKVKLPDPERAFRSYPHQLSGGQKQRVMIAMALSCQPAVLIADEPTTALDVTVQKHILTLLRQLQQEMAAAVVFITHDLGVIAEVADRVLVMYKGQIVEEGPVADVFSRPQHPYTKGLLACRPPLDVRLRRLPVVADFMTADTQTDGSIVLTEKAADVADVTARMRVSAAETAERQAALYAQTPLLEVKDLKAWYPQQRNFWGKPTQYVKAVDGVSFNVFEGETLGLVGESGCGKTTLGRAIVRLSPISSGSIWYKGRDITHLSKAEAQDLCREIQIVFQDPYASLNPRMTIGSALLEPMQVHGLHGSDAERRDKVIELLETVNLEAQHFNRYPHEFSGGQRQRICIARALAVSPRFIICDESVSALDVSVQAQVLNLLINLREKMAFTSIFISHDLSVVKFISDRMLVMNKGRIVEMGYADAVYEQPKEAYTQELITAIPKGLSV